MVIMGGGTSALTRTGSWFKPELRTKNYDSLGDAYDDMKYFELTKQWNVDTAQKRSKEHGPEPFVGDKYLTLVKQASRTKWIHLRLLADFMQIGRIPRDWGRSLIPPDQQQRWGRANMCVMEYLDDAVETRYISSTGDKGLTAEELRGELHNGNVPTASFRLYVVEDLSRNAIEALGTEFGIEPDVFRAHIADYAWYNARDRWREAPPLEVFRRQRNWFQIRYVTTRYFENRSQFDRAGDEAKEFNILRRPDDDKSKGWWDSEDAVVALTRSRATFWLKPKDGGGDARTAVLLLDPTVSQGLPLWRGHRDFHPVPSPDDPPSGWPAWEAPARLANHDPSSRDWFRDFVYWARHADVLDPRPGLVPREHLPLRALLHLVGSEWLTVCDYIKTRLNQIDLETVDPEHFAADKQVDVALGKLHMWRRFIPLYREMVTDTLQHVFSFPCHAVTPVPDGVGPAREHCPGRRTAGRPPLPSPSPPSSSSSIGAYEEDFRLVLGYLEEYQSRIDRLTSVVTAVMAVGDTRTANTDARNLGRLTWLATFFIPFSVVSGIFGMNNVPELSLDTIRLYFAVTVPVSVATVALAWAIHSPLVRAWLQR